MPAKKPTPKPKPFVWTPEDAFDEILKDMQQVAGQPGRRLEVRGKGAHTTFTVKCATYEGEAINKTRECPIVCP